MDGGRPVHGGERRLSTSREIRFSPTRWSVVRRAASSDHDARAAMGQLIEAYWQPAYAFVRMRGRDPDTAADLTQGFFLSLLEGSGVSGIEPDRGVKFRSYLLGALEHYLANETRARGAAKRGGGRPVFSIDRVTAESQFTSHPASDETPATCFDRHWARILLDRAMTRLEADLDAEGKSVQFRTLVASLAPGAPTYAEIAAGLGIKSTDVTNHLHRARRRLRQLLVREALDQTDDLSAAERELAELFLE